MTTNNARWNQEAMLLSWSITYAGIFGQGVCRCLIQLGSQPCLEQDVGRADLQCFLPYIFHDAITGSYGRSLIPRKSPLHSAGPLKQWLWLLLGVCSHKHLSEPVNLCACSLALSRAAGGCGALHWLSHRDPQGPAFGRFWALQFHLQAGKAMGAWQLWNWNFYQHTKERCAM